MAIYKYVPPSLFPTLQHVTFLQNNVPLTLTWMFPVPWILLSNQIFHSECHKRNCIYTIIHSDLVPVLMLWQRKVKAFMNLNIFHINYVNIMINNQLHSLFKACNVAFFPNYTHHCGRMWLQRKIKLFVFIQCCLIALSRKLSLKHWMQESTMLSEMITVSKTSDLRWQMN